VRQAYITVEGAAHARSSSRINECTRTGRRSGRPARPARFSCLVNGLDGRVDTTGTVGSVRAGSPLMHTAICVASRGVNADTAVYLASVRGAPRTGPRGLLAPPWTLQRERPSRREIHGGISGDMRAIRLHLGGLSADMPRYLARLRKTQWRYTAVSPENRRHADPRD
jgi:hypothetical protein